MLRYPTYAENIRMAAKTKDNAQRRPLHIRELASLTGLSYEHVRKLWMGRYSDKLKMSVSRDANYILCDVLGLDPDAMWDMAQREKTAQKLGYLPMQLEDPEGKEMAELWEHMNKDQHGLLLQVARTMATVSTNR